MDRIDRKLLNLLQEDASRTNLALAERVGLSPSTCLRRIRRFLDLVIREEAVSQAHAVTGEADVVLLLLLLRLKDMEEYDALCNRLFRDQTNVARFVTMMVIRSAKETTAVRL